MNQDLTWTQKLGEACLVQSFQWNDRATDAKNPASKLTADVPDPRWTPVK